MPITMSKAGKKRAEAFIAKNPEFEAVLKAANETIDSLRKQNAGADRAIRRLQISRQMDRVQHILESLPKPSNPDQVQKLLRERVALKRELLAYSH